jgi:hypothetical protein
MPEGSSLQFRYDLRWVAGIIRDRLLGKDGKGTSCLIAYIDQSDPNKAPELIPCRFATLLEAEAHGSTVSLVLTLHELAYAEDLDAFNNEMRSASAGVLPAWQPDGKLKGSYWFETAQELETVVRSQSLAEWEKIVTQTAGRSDFEDESTFYTVEGLHRVAPPGLVSARNGAYPLAPGQEYELRFYHFHPTKEPVGSSLRVQTSSQSLKFTTSQDLVLDSRYDLKRVRIRTNSPPLRRTAILTILRKDPRQVEPKLDFDLRVEIKGAFWKTLGYGSVLGLLLGTPPVVSAFSNPSLPAQNVAVITIASVVVGLFTGIFAAFGLKEPL